MKLYYLPGACPLASHIVLEWVGKPYETQKVARTELKSPEFLALNPVGSVPVLTDGDMTLTQSAAILEYLAELNPQAKLHGETPKQRAEVRRWLGFCNADLHRTFAILFGAPASDDDTCQKNVVAATIKRLIVLFRVVNDHLTNKKWLADNRSIADPYLYVLLRWANAKQLDMSEFGNLKSFYDQMNSDPGVKAALTAQGIA